MNEAERWLFEQRAVWEARLDRLELYVKAIEQASAEDGHPTKARRDAGIGFGAVEYGYQTLDKRARYAEALRN